MGVPKCYVCCLHTPKHLVDLKLRKTDKIWGTRSCSHGLWFCPALEHISASKLYTGLLHPFNSDLSLQRGGLMIVETVALSARVLVLDLSQMCSIMLRQSFLKIPGS